MLLFTTRTNTFCNHGAEKTASGCDANQITALIANLVALIDKVVACDDVPKQ